MARRFRRFLSFLAILACANLLPAQPAPKDEQIRLGDSVAALNGPWKFHVGDFPIDPATHQPLWSEPGFDDSSWETVDLTPTKGVLDPVSGLSGFVPGWTAKGHAGY
jgi:hypothetical protein